MAKTITKTETAEVLFLSRGPITRLVRVPSQSIYGSAGQYAGEQPGAVRYEFEDHQMRVRPGEDVLPDGPPDEDGNPTMQDKLTWLRNHPGFNGEEANSFHEHGAEPERIPDPGPTLDQITNLAIYGDVDGLRDLMAEEKNSHGRQIVLERAQAALDSVEAAIAASPPQTPENG